jgi:hypothetical protein
MKRKEMIYRIAGLLSAMYETDKHPEVQVPNAENLLDALEEWGMKAPLTKRCPVLLRTEHVWEQENV